jgi:DNA polymerase-3 subunit gamma/tau
VPAPEPATIGVLTLDQIQREWPEVLKALAKISRSTWVAAQTIKIVALADGILTLEFPNVGESDTFKRSAGGPANLRKAIEEGHGFVPQFKAQIAANAAVALPPKVTSSLPSMPAPGPAFPESVTLPAPAPGPVPAAAPAKKVAPAAVPMAAPVPEAEPVPAPVSVDAPADEEPPLDDEPPVQSAPAAETGMGKVHQGASYGEPLLREILGAKPIDDSKSGR